MRGGVRVLVMCECGCVGVGVILRMLVVWMG